MNLIPDRVTHSFFNHAPVKWSAVAQEKFDSTQDVHWRWNDFGDERTDDTSIFRGAVHVSWSRNAGCVIPRDDPDHPRITPNPIPLKVSIDTINNSRDYLYPQPDIISYGVHTKKHKCDAHAKATIQIFRFADSGQTIKLEITNVSPNKNHDERFDS